MPKNPARELQELTLAQMQIMPTQEAEDHITGNTVSHITDLPTDTLTDVSSGTPTYTPSEVLTDTPTSKTVRQSVSRKTDRAAGKSDPKPEIKALASSRAEAITVKLPAAMNAYLDRHIHENWERKLKKQDLLKRAVALLVYELETGEELVSLDV